MTTSSIAGTQSIERTIQLLKKVATHNTAGLTLAEAARQTGLKVPTVHRMLSCLAEQGLLVQRGSKKGYFLGMLAYELGLAASSHFNLRELCGPVLARISRVTGDTVFLTTRSGLDSVVIERKEGSYPIKVLTQTVGERRPLGSTAGGLALLAAMPCSESEDLITKNLHRLSGYGFLSEPVLRQMLQRARRLGFALNDGDLLVDVTGIGVAIPSDLGSPYAALSVVALSKRIDAKRRREIVGLLNEEGAKLRDTLAGEEVHRH
jgi:DNA-binding IclR family transcriptional regulator